MGVTQRDDVGSWAGAPWQLARAAPRQMGRVAASGEVSVAAVRPLPARYWPLEGFSRESASGPCANRSPARSRRPHQAAAPGVGSQLSTGCLNSPALTAQIRRL